MMTMILLSSSRSSSPFSLSIVRQKKWRRRRQSHQQDYHPNGTSNSKKKRQKFVLMKFSNVLLLLMLVMMVLSSSLSSIEVVSVNACSRDTTRFSAGIQHKRTATIIDTTSRLRRYCYDSDNGNGRVSRSILAPSLSSYIHDPISILLVRGRRRTTLSVMTTRGGGDPNENTIKNSSSSSNKKKEIGHHSSNEKKEDTDDINEHKSRQHKRQRPAMALSSPFYLNELARYEASMVADDREGVQKDDNGTFLHDDSKNDNSKITIVASESSTDHDHEQRQKKKKAKKKKHHHHHEDSNIKTDDDSKITQESAPNNNRTRHNKKGRDCRKFIVGGGATTKTTTDTGASQDDDDVPEEQESTITSTEEVERQDSSERNNRTNDITDIARLWWVNMWTQQLSDDSPIEEEENDDDVNEPSEILIFDEIMISSDDDDQQQVVELESEILTVEREDDDESEGDEISVINEDLTTTILNDTNDTTESLDSTTLRELRRESSPPMTETLHGEISNSGNLTDSDRSYISSGVWIPIDNLMTLGLASRYSSLRLSRQLRGARKWTAHVTGLHGALSGKPSRSTSRETSTVDSSALLHAPGQEEMHHIQRRIAAIDRARKVVERVKAADNDQQSRRRTGIFRGLFRGKNKEEASDNVSEYKNDTILLEDSEVEKEFQPKIRQKTPEEIEDDLRRMERVREIDRLISDGQKRLIDLICEKDVLQRRPNPLFDYTTTESTRTEVLSDEISADDSPDNTTSSHGEIKKTIEIQASRKMNFPPDDLVAEYLDMMISTGRLIKMNHTYLWKESETSEDDEEETIGDDLFTASADAHRLYQNTPTSRREGPQNGNGKNGNTGSGGGGSWLLRQSIGNGPSLGEKIGETVETAAYKAVCAALMSFLARLLSSLHGINVMKHSDIRLVLEQAPDLPLVGKEGIIPGSANNYAEETIKTVMRRKSKKYRKRSKHRPTEDSFVQRDAVTEMLLSHVQISAPLLKLFPTAWQRALLGNIITLSTAVISDFLDGLSFQILGHQLSFSFRPITEEDMIRHFQIMSGKGLNHRRYKAAEFEAAVRATAEDVSEELKFLDRWHERALGSGVLRTQIANMIARIVLTLTDEILVAARMDLWSAQAGGPRMLAGLEYRIEA